MVRSATERTSRLLIVVGIDGEDVGIAILRCAVAHGLGSGSSLEMEPPSRWAPIMSTR